MDLIEMLRARADFEDKRVLDDAKSMGFEPEVYTGSQTGAILREAAAALEAAREDAERYRALVASGKFAPSFNSGWALATGTYRATKGELDAAADALAAQQGGAK